LAGHWHLKGHLFNLGLSDSPTCDRCRDKDETPTHVLCECEALAHRRLRHLGQYFMDPSDYFDAPHVQDPAFHSKCRIAEGMNGRGSTIYHCRSRCKGRGPAPYVHIHTYTTYKLNLHRLIIFKCIMTLIHALRYLVMLCRVQTDCTHQENVTD
jgi:hypothetical protein